MSFEKKKILTIKEVPDHIKKLQELRTQIKIEEKPKQDKKIPIYQKEVFKTAMEWLYTTFPKCFTHRDQRPLKISIFEDIMLYIEQNVEEANRPSKRGIRLALATYTRNRFYLKACTDGAKRVNLNGEDAEAITSSEAEYALGMYNKYNQVFKDKKKREKQEKRKPSGNKPYNKTNNFTFKKDATDKSF